MSLLLRALLILLLTALPAAAEQGHGEGGTPVASTGEGQADPGDGAHGGAAHGEHMVEAAMDAAAESKGGGLPQLDPTYFTSQIFWTIVAFVSLYLIMSKVALPGVAEVLRVRRERIATDLDVAEETIGKSAEVEAAGKAALDRARERARTIHEKAEKEVRSIVGRKQAELSKVLDERLAQADRRIADIQAQSTAAVRAVATDIAATMVSKAAGVDLKPDAIAPVVDTVVGAPQA